MMRFASRGGFAALGFCIFLSGVASAALDKDPILWKGPDGGYLDAEENWSGMTGVTKRLKFEKTPSAAYTVKLSNDWEVGALFQQSGQNYYSSPLRVTFDLRDGSGAAHTLYQRETEYWRAGGNEFNLINGTISCTTAAGATNSVTLDNGNNNYQKLRVLGPNSALVGNFTVRSGHDHEFVVANGARWSGIMLLDTDDSTFFVTNKATFVGSTVKDGHPTWIGGYDLKSTGCRNAQLIVDDAMYDARGVGAAHFYLGCGVGSDSNKVIVRNGGHIELPYYCCLGGVSQAWGNTRESCNNEFIVTGPGSTVSNSLCSSDFPMMIGSAGTNNLFHLTDHATGYATELRVGGQMKVANGNFTSMYNKAVIDMGSRFDCASISVAGRHGDQRVQDALALGHLTAYNSLVVTGGAQVVASGNCAVGRSSFVRDNSLVVSGAGTLFQCKGLSIGDLGAHSNRVEVTDGARLEYNGDLCLGYGISSGECGRFRDGETWMRGCGNVLWVENAVVTNRANNKTVWLGSYTNGNDNAIFVGNAVDWRDNTLKMSGFRNTFAVSNSTVRFTNGFYPVESPDDPVRNGTNCLAFAGTKPRLIVTGGNGGYFKQGCRLRFDLPGRMNGYEQAPLETSYVAFNFNDDTKLEFGPFHDFVKAGGGKVELVRDSSPTHVLGVSDALLASWTAQARAAAAADPDAAGFAKNVSVTLSANKKLLTLDFPRTYGMVLIFR